jgi:diaminopimelate decarboxylase
MSISDLKSLADKFGTPLYIYESQRIRENLSAILSSIPYQATRVYYAAMCNNHPEILKLIKGLSIGV